ncbi:GL25301 [Drosophila persimilis]|uniref:GL25301 n=1 Tax=Drosophila persimilis TaxID=7234 RepID=B4GS11_DROPE|nr:GL25301 [Drosophila persimilis]
MRTDKRFCRALFVQQKPETVGKKEVEEKLSQHPLKCFLRCLLPLEACGMASPPNPSYFSACSQRCGRSAKRKDNDDRDEDEDVDEDEDDSDAPSPCSC